MLPPARKPRLVVVSPTLDKRHGTERCVAEQIERLAGDYEIHLYSESVEGVNLQNIAWHRVYVAPGPHLFRYVWWFFANHLCRWRDRHFRGVIADIVYSPCVNCLDANVVSVHIVFAEFRRQVGKTLELRRNSCSAWPLLVHRRIYYRLCIFLERLVYRNQRVTLAAISAKTARDVAECCGRDGDVAIVYYGLEPERFNPERRRAMRPPARAALGIPDEAFVILLIGNDWKKKGLRCLLEAAGQLANGLLRVLVVGHDALASYQEMIRRLGMTDRVMFLPLRSDVEFYYAAADVYAGPSLEDAFALPPAEAMACGLPAITTRMAGASEIVTHGEDGLILEDPSDVRTLSEWLQRLSTDTDWRNRMGDAASHTAAKYTWAQNASQMREIIDRVIAARRAATQGGPANHKKESALR
jgi:glycosyltransferase involved in cell wall biosynthesis